VISLFDVKAMKHIWAFSRSEFAIAAVAIAGVLASGPENGVLLGAAISIVLLLRQAASPRVTELARTPGTDQYSDFVRHPENERTPGVLVVRCEASLLYFNVEHVRDRVFELLAARHDQIRLVVVFLGTAPRVDFAGAEFVHDLRRAIRARGIDFRLAGPNGWVRDALRRIGFERDYGPLHDLSVNEVVSEWQTQTALRGSAIPQSA
jgi:MFS superfamily sulfate permease-like transporter